MNINIPKAGTGLDSWEYTFILALFHFLNEGPNTLIPSDVLMDIAHHLEEEKAAGAFRCVTDNWLAWIDVQVPLLANKDEETWLNFLSSLNDAGYKQIYWAFKAVSPFGGNILIFVDYASNTADAGADCHINKLGIDVAGLINERIHRADMKIGDSDKYVLIVPDNNMNMSESDVKWRGCGIMCMEGPRKANPEYKLESGLIDELNKLADEYAGVVAGVLQTVQT